MQTVGEFCQNSDTLQTILIIKMVVQIGFIVVPIIVIIMSLIKLKHRTNNYNIAKTNAIKKIIICIFSCFVPFLINYLMNYLSDKVDSEIVSCYMNANSQTIEYYLALEKNENTEKLEEEKENSEEENQRQNVLEKRAKAKKSVTLNNSIFIGDSRTVGMYLAVYSASSSTSIDTSKEGNYWYASAGQGYSWFSSSGVNKIKSILSNGNYNVIVQMGVNDLGTLSSADEYVNTMASLAKIYTSSNFVIVNVGPIDDDKLSSNYSIKNGQVKSFNNRLYSTYELYDLSNLKYCDLYSSIISKYSTSDGIHYIDSTYRSVYKAINNC